jgi:hypothetical protein
MLLLTLTIENFFFYLMKERAIRLQFIFTYDQRVVVETSKAA